MNSKQQSTKRNEIPLGFGTTGLMIFVVVMLMVGLCGWLIINTHDQAATSTTSTRKSTAETSGHPNQGQTDPSEDSKYLVIKEWGLRVALPVDFRGKATYQIAPNETDPDTGLPLNSAVILVAADEFSADVCAVTTTDVGPSIKAGATYIRSSNAKPFNASRYKGAFKENILTDTTYSYHLSSVIPDCLGGGANAAKLQELQSALTDLTKV